MIPGQGDMRSEEVPGHTLAADKLAVDFFIRTQDITLSRSEINTQNFSCPAVIHFNFLQSCLFHCTAKNG